MKVLLIVLSLLFTSPAWATTYWFAASGGDASCHASATDPGAGNYRNISGAQTAIPCLAAGDIAVFKAGTYNIWFTNPLISGTSPSAPTTMQCEASRTCILKPVGGGASGNVIILSSARSNLAFKNFKCDLTSLTSTEKNCWRTSDGQSFTGILVDGFESTGGTSAMIVADGVNGATFSNNLLYGFDNPGAGGGTGYYIRGDNNIIEHNEIHGNGIATTASGFQMYSSAGGVNGNIARYNYIHNMPTHGIYGGTGSGNVIHNNIIRNTDKGITVRGTNTKVYNNSIYSVTTGMDVSAGAGCSIINNALPSESLGTADADCTYSKNIATNGDISTSVTPTQLWISPTTNNFSLIESSAGIDTGAVISGFSAGRYVGAGVDVGALEACVRDKSVVENDEPTHYHIGYSCPIQSSRNNLTLQTPTVGNWTIVVAGVSKTLGNGGLVSAGINGQSTVELVLASAVTNGQSLTDAMTRSSAPTLMDSVTIGDPNGTVNVNHFNAQVRTHAAASGTNNVGAAPSHVVVQSHYKFHKLRGNEDAPVVQCATCTEDVPITLPPGAAFRLRVKFRSDDNVGALYVLRYAIDTGGGFGAYTLTPDAMGADNISWYGITADTDIPAAGTPTTELLTSDEASNTACAVIRTSSDYPTIVLNNQETECEYVLKISTAAAVGTKYRFQVWGSGGTPLDTYTVTPELTVGSYTMMES